MSNAEKLRARRVYLKKLKSALPYTCTKYNQRKLLSEISEVRDQIKNLLELEK
jgi:hypothetical protein